MSWEQLLSIYKQQAEDVRDEATKVPTACPNDGQPLQTGPNGELFCDFDGWQYR